MHTRFLLESLFYSCQCTKYVFFYLQICSLKTASFTIMQATAVWHNMREEPVVYINGRPFVLREEARPFKNLREYAGIDPHRLEKMERRLKLDILQEVSPRVKQQQCAH